MTKRVAVVLSGCGFLDGAEIHESVLTLLHLHKQGVEPVCFAPNIPQAGVTNHLSQKPADQTRNVLEESARIARTEVQDLKDLNGADYDALIFPGGFGAALNLCDFGKKGADCEILEDVARVITEFSNNNKPLGFICIAPALGAKVLGSKGVKLTIGTDADTATQIEKLGAKHTNCAVDEICEDEALKVVSTPAYMLGKTPLEVESGIAKCVQTLCRWIT